MVPRQMATATTGPADWREALDIVALGLPEQVMLLLTSHSSPTTLPLVDVLCSFFSMLYCGI